MHTLIYSFTLFDLVPNILHDSAKSLLCQNLLNFPYIHNSKTHIFANIAGIENTVVSDDLVKSISISMSNGKEIFLLKIVPKNWFWMIFPYFHISQNIMEFFESLSLRSPKGTFSSPAFMK